MTATHTRTKSVRTAVLAGIAPTARRSRQMLIALALAVSLAACAAEKPASSGEFLAEATRQVTSGTATVGDPSACTHVDTPMVDIPSADATEPQMRIPVPPGWERSYELDGVSEDIRFTLAKTDPLAAEPPQTVAVVTLEPAPDADTQAIFDYVRADLVQMLDAEDLPTDHTTAAATVCGLPAETVTYTDAAARELQTLAITALNVVIKVGGDTYFGHGAGHHRVGRPDVPARYRGDPDGIRSVAARHGECVVVMRNARPGSPLHA